MLSFFAEIIAGIEPVASVRGYGLLLCSSGDDAPKERAEIEMLRGRQVDGIVIASACGAGNAAILQQLMKNGTTVVMIDRDDHPAVKCHRVLTDDEQVGQLATSHLLDTGRRAIAHIGGPPIVHAKRRERGWREALKARGVKAKEDWIVRGGFTESDGSRAMQRLLTVRPRVEAVFAANDPSAIGAMKAIWEAGLRVPDDVAVVGAGDIVYGDLLRVPLTTVGWSRRDQGRQAAELLLNGLDRDIDPPQRITIPPRLVVRDSSGPAT
jgi:LacI family transcriptional regulator